MGSPTTHFIEPLIVVLDCHGQLQQLPQQVLGVAEGDPQFTRMKLGTVRQADDCLGCGNRHSPGAESGFCPLKIFGQPVPPRTLLPELAARLQSLHLPEQGSAVDQEGLAGLVAAEAVKQLDGAAPPDAEDLLNDSPVQDRGLERGNGRADGGKS